MRCVARVRVANDAACTHAIKSLQVTRDLFKYVKAARAVHLAYVRRHHNAIVPAQRDRTFHMSANSQHRLSLPVWQRELTGCATAANPQRAHPARNAPVDRIVSRPHDRPIVLQECIGNGLQAT